jgi:hypothetical protein
MIAAAAHLDLVRGRFAGLDLNAKPGLELFTGKVEGRGAP